MNPNSVDQKNSENLSGNMNSGQPTQSGGTFAMDVTRNPQAGAPQYQRPAEPVVDPARAAMDGVAPAMAGTIPSRMKHPKIRLKRTKDTRPAPAPMPDEVLPQVNNSNEIEPEDNHKSKTIVILAIVGVVAIIAIIVLSILLKGGGIEWKTGYGDIDLEYVAQSTVKLGVEADSGVLDGISYDGSCDRNEKIKKPERDGNDVKWDLSEGVGKCTLRARYQLRTIEKTFTVVSRNIERESLGLEDIYRTKISQDADDDGDGLTNKREKTINTKIDLTDSDGDGLADGYEVNTLKTDPLKSDSDGDGLNDGSEVKLGYNPTKADSKGDGVKDGERKLSYTYKSDSATLKLSGKGDIANTTIDITKGAALSKKTGLIPRLYSFYTAGKTDEIKVIISYTDEQLSSAKIKEKDLTIYRYDLSDAKYEKVDTKIDSNNKTVSATLTDLSSYYVVGSKSGAKLDSKGSEIMFVLDNSWSMYTNEQYKKLNNGQDHKNKLEASDPDGRRFKLTKELAEKLDKKGVKIGVGEFSGDYATVKKVGTSIEDLKTTLDGMNEHFHIKQSGTNITDAIRGGAKELSSSANLKTLIVLTDGKDNKGLASVAYSLASEMANKNIRVCVLGFGEGAYSDEVSIITDRTGCKYFSSSDVTGLDEVFNNLEVLLNDELADVDGDGKMDGYVMADSGFMVTRDGFSFRNYSSDLMTNGHCYGMATFAQLYYSKKMPLRHNPITAAGLTSSSYNLNWSYFKDYQNLYDYKLQTNALKYVPQFGAEYFGEQEAVNKYSVKDGAITYSDKIRAEIDKTGIFGYYKSNTKEKSDVQMQKYGFSYNSIEKARLNETKMQSSATMNDIDRSLMNAIFASQIRQASVKMYSSGSAIGIDGAISRTASKQMTNSNDFMDLLASRMRKHEAPVILAYFSGGLHAMNAINLIQDAKDSNHYYIGVYDSNYPGEKRYLELKCSKYSCTTKSNDYYSESGEVIRISISQAEDLRHFEEIVVEEPEYYDEN